MKKEVFFSAILFLLYAAVFPCPVYPESANTDQALLEDELFEGNLVDEQDQKSTPAANNTDKETGKAAGDSFSDYIIEDRKPQWNGFILSAFHTLFLWNDYRGIEQIGTPLAAIFQPDLKLTLGFDLRPDPDFRLFVKTKLFYPLALNVNSGSDVLSLPNMQIFELFTDFDWDGKAFFKVGKQVIGWGVGRFFSPVDILNLTHIDPDTLDEQDIEGPLAVKVHIPFPGINFFTYVIANDITSPEDLAVASKVQFVFGANELGLGGFLKKDSAPRIISTFTSNPGFSLRLFMEMSLSFGSDRVFVQENPLSPYGVSTFYRKDEPFYLATAGMEYTSGNLQITGQYFFNGDGYANSNLLVDAFNYRNDPLFNITDNGPVLSDADLLFFGLHYGIVSLKWDRIMDSGLGLELRWLGNLTDGSGNFLAQLNYELFKYLSIAIGTRLPYGVTGHEYTREGRYPLLILSTLWGTRKF